jgi:predicted ribonuclease YlaK
LSKNTGINYITITGEQINEFYHKGFDFNNYDLRPNEYVIVKQPDGLILAKKKVKNNKLVDVPFIAIGNGKGAFKPLNPEQECAFDLMADDTIKIKILIGLAGSGKTKIAIKFGMEKLKREQISKLFFVRNPVAVGEEVGFFRGDKNSKVLNWNNPIKDNLEDRLDTLEELILKGRVEIDIPATMKGRDIKDSWIIVDEAEDLTEEQFKMIGERVSTGSYIIFCGDTGQVTKEKYRKSNGLQRAFNIRGIQVFGCVELVEDVRSETSKIFATLY